MPTLHVIVSKDLKRWLEQRAKREEVHGSMSMYCARILIQHRAHVVAEEKQRAAEERHATAETPSSEPTIN